MSFGKAEAEEEEEQTEVSPGMQQIIGKLEQQEKRFVCNIMENNTHEWRFLFQCSLQYLKTEHSTPVYIIKLCVLGFTL